MIIHKIRFCLMVGVPPLSKTWSFPLIYDLHPVIIHAFTQLSLTFVVFAVLTRATCVIGGACQWPRTWFIHVLWCNTHIGPIRVCIFLVVSWNYTCNMVKAWCVFVLHPLIFFFSSCFGKSVPLRVIPRSWWRHSRKQKKTFLWKQGLSKTRPIT